MRNARKIKVGDTEPTSGGRLQGAGARLEEVHDGPAEVREAHLQWLHLERVWAPHRTQHLAQQRVSNSE